MDRDLVALERGEDGAAAVVFDEPGRPVNVLRGEVFEALSAALDEVARMDPAPSRVVFASGKPGTFIAGADLRVIRDASDSELDAVLKRGQVLLSRIAALPMPTVALIGGSALGGGLEVALACGARVVAAGARPVLGLPEVMLGLVPGWGGTVRLPRVVGVKAAVALLLSGRSLTPAEASGLGLVDAVVPAEAMADAAGSVVASSPVEPDGWAATIELARTELSAAEPVRRRASEAVLATLEAGLRDGEQAGYDAERRHLIALRNSHEGRELIARFFARKKK